MATVKVRKQFFKACLVSAGDMAAEVTLLTRLESLSCRRWRHGNTGDFCNVAEKVFSLAAVDEVVAKSMIVQPALRGNVGGQHRDRDNDASQSPSEK